MPRPLPVELLFHIVDLALSPDETVSEYGECEKLPTSLCLVSHQLRDIAQPLLWRIFRPKKDHLHLAASFPHLAEHAHILQLRGVIRDLDAVLQTIDCMPNLAELRCEGPDDVIKKQFRQLKDLEHLFLRDTRMISFSSIVFRNLVSLTIHKLGSNGRSVTPLLPAASSPKLKALYTTSSESDWIGHTWIYTLLEPGGLDNQIDMLQVNANVVRTVGGDLRQRNLPVLLTFPLQSAAEIPKTRYNRFCHFQLDAWGAHEFACNYDHLLPLPSLSSASLFRCRPWECLIALRDRILSTCASREIDVIWRLDSKKPVDDEGVSRDFWRYAKEIKRKKAIESEGGRGGVGSA
ncbi:hypothetical protein JCM8547_007017 [Rhodosporidiobolus lusitaniae]